MSGAHFLARVTRLNRALMQKRISGETFDAIIARVHAAMESNGYYL